MKHFKLRTDLTIQVLGITLYRIEALVDFKYASKGQLGGYVESEKNLSNNAWVSGDAYVYGNAQVSGDARVFGNAQVFGNAYVYGNAYVFGNAYVYGNARVFGDAQVFGNAYVYGNAQVFGDAQVSIKMILKTKYDYINILGIKFSATISLTGINVGCKSYVDLKDFEARYKQEGTDNNYTDIELKYLYVSIKNSLKLIKSLNRK